MFKCIKRFKTGEGNRWYARINVFISIIQFTLDLNLRTPCSTLDWNQITYKIRSKQIPGSSPLYEKSLWWCKDNIGKWKKSFTVGQSFLWSWWSCRSHLHSVHPYQALCCFSWTWEICCSVFIVAHGCSCVLCIEHVHVLEHGRRAAVFLSLGFFFPFSYISLQPQLWLQGLYHRPHQGSERCGSN